MINWHGKRTLNRIISGILRFCIHAHIILRLAKCASCCGNRTADVSVCVAIKFAGVVLRPDRYLDYLLLQICVVGFPLKHTLSKQIIGDGFYLFTVVVVKRLPERIIWCVLRSNADVWVHPPFLVKRGSVYGTVRVSCSLVLAIPGLVEWVFLCCINYWYFFNF